MPKKGFTFAEILVVLTLIGIVSVFGIRGFKHARDAHRVDSLLQELALLRTAILSYKETYGSLTEIAENELSSSSFDKLKPFWYPFRPENSKVIEGGKWYGQIGSNVALCLKQKENYVAFDISLLKKKIQKLGDVRYDGTYFYILGKNQEENTEQSTTISSGARID